MIENKIDVWKLKKAQADALQADIAELAEEIKNEMTERELKELNGVLLVNRKTQTYSPELLSYAKKKNIQITKEVIDNSKVKAAISLGVFNSETIKKYTTETETNFIQLSNKKEGTK
jgi:hypothetical protein